MLQLVRSIMLFSLLGFTPGFGAIQAISGEGFGLVLVDKQTNRVFLGEYKKDQIVIKKDYHATMGKVIGDKMQENDLKTPEGIYFFTAQLRPPSIKPKFGDLALYMNYPNPIDKREGKTGFDIMLHATNDPSRLTKDYDSKGCIVVSNSEIEEISKDVQLGLTPIIVYPEMKPEYLSKSYRPELMGQFQKWLEAWRNKDIQSYIDTYTSDFSFNGMNKKQYQQYKNNLNKKYSEIAVEASDVRFLYHPKYDVVFFTQKYESRLKNGRPGFISTGTKILYFVKEDGQYRIASEGYSTTTVN